MLQQFITSAPHFALSAIAAVAGLFIVICVHEFGHFWVARRCGVQIETFSIGFGKEIFGWTDKHGTRWKVSWLPLGGYVKMFGDANPASMPGDGVKTMTDDEKRVAFFHQSIGKRMAVVVAGPAFNYFFAIIVMALFFTFQGQPYTTPDVSSVIEDSAAAAVGIKTGDHIVSVDGRPIERFEDIIGVVAMNSGTPVSMEILRNNEPIKLMVTPKITVVTDRFGGQQKIGRIGITSDTSKTRKLTPIQSVRQAAVESWNLTVGTVKAIGQIIMGTRSASELQGPASILGMLGHAGHDGFVSWIHLVAFISVNLGFVNLLPIPLLDGGHLAFYTYEKLFGRPLNERVQEMGMRIGMAMILSLMLFVTWNDLSHFGFFIHFRDWLFS